MELNLEKIRNFVESMEETDFHHYISPTSYYNTDLKHSICDESLIGVPHRELLELYFFLSENEDEISQIVFDKLYSIEEDEDVEMNGLNWYVIVYFMLRMDYKSLYDNLYSKVRPEILKLININEDFERDKYYIINDYEDETTYYCEKLSDCYSYLISIDKKVDAEELIRTETYRHYKISMKKGDIILFYLKMYRPKTENGYFLDVQRRIKLRKIRAYNEHVITEFELFTQRVN